MNKIKIKVKLNHPNYKGDYSMTNYYIFVVDIECLTEQKSFTNETGTFYIKSFLPVKEELYDYECELYTIEEYRNIQLEKLIN